jgi:ATP-binding cassette subfamily F protein 3
VLEAFDGTILLVSHDRYLIDRLATRIWEIRDQDLITFNGTYREYILRKPAAGTAGAPARKMLLQSAPMARDNSKKTRQLTQTLEQLEDRIRTKEKEIQHLSRELQLAGKKGVFDHMHDLSHQMAQAEAKLDDLLHEWENLVA